jgi:hypothetical protein
MDTSLLVEFQLEAGRLLISQLTSDGFEVAAAFWATTPDDDYWYLYIATPLVELHGSAQSYRILWESLRKLEGTTLSFADIKIIGATNPIARDVVKILEKSSGKLGLNYSGKTLGGMVVERAFLYARHLYDPDESQKRHKKEILDHLFENLKRGPGVFEPDQIALRDGSSFTGHLTTLNVNSEGKVSAIFLVQSDANREVDVDDIVSIH